MTHEAGILAALKASDEVPPHTYFDTVSARQDAVIEAIIQAYLSASGMVLVPRHPTREMVTKWRDDFMKKYSSGECENSHSVHMGLDLASAIDAAQDPFKSKPGE